MFSPCMFVCVCLYVCLCVCLRSFALSLWLVRQCCAFSVAPQETWRPCAKKPFDTGPGIGNSGGAQITNVGHFKAAKQSRVEGRWALSRDKNTALIKILNQRLDCAILTKVLPEHCKMHLHCT